MSLTTILAASESVGINDHRFVGQLVSRNQRISTSEILTVVPFSFDLKPNNYLLYSQSRLLLAQLRYPDKALEQYINFASTGWVNYIKYQGDMTSTQIASCVWTTGSSGRTLQLGSLPSIDQNQFIVKIGDFCQVGRYSYIAVDSVQRGTGSTVSINVHRNLITPVTSNINAVIGEYGTTVSMGGISWNGVTFPVILRDYPTYTLVPMTNDSFISWSGNFVAFESVL
jgi:hypothetical protein